MKPELIIFDKDGTLIDDNKLFIPTLSTMIKNAKPYIEDKKKFYKFIDYDEKSKEIGSKSFLRSQPYKVSVKKISKFLKLPEKEARDLFVDLKFNKKTVVPYVNLEDLFSTLKREGIKIAINTSDRRINTEKCIKILGIGKYLDMVVCGDDGIKTKPSPATNIIHLQ